MLTSAFKNQREHGLHFYFYFLTVEGIESIQLSEY